jgi:hypothetical protein
VRLLDLSAELSAAAIRDGSLEIAYRSTARVFAVIDREVAALEIDGAEVPLNTRRAPAGWLVMLPRGQHLVTFIPSSKKGAHP